MEHDQHSYAVVNEIFLVEEAKVAFKKYRKCNCASFQNETLMALICLEAIITEAVDSFKAQVDLKGMQTGQIVSGHANAVDGSMRFH